MATLNEPFGVSGRIYPFYGQDDETNKLFSDGNTDDTPLGQILDELRNMGSEDLMNT